MLLNPSWKALTQAHLGLLLEKKKKKVQDGKAVPGRILHPVCVTDHCLHFSAGRTSSSSRWQRDQVQRRTEGRDKKDNTGTVTA
jgi:hypothetical protein